MIKIYKVNKKNIKYNLSKPTMIPVRKINIDKIKNLIKYKSNFSIYEGVSKTITWYRKNYIKNENKR